MTRVRNWIQSFGPDARELVWLLALGTLLVVGFSAWVLYRYYTGQPVKSMLGSFAGAAIGSYIGNRLLGCRSR